MNIALPHYETIWKDPQANLKQKELLIKKIVQKNPEIDLIVFPELSFHGFIMDEENKTFAEPIDGFCVTETQKLAQKYNVAIVAGFIEANTEGNPFNTAFAVGHKGNLLTTYRKNKLFTASDEPQLYTPGSEISTFEIEGRKFGLGICFDLRFGEIFKRYRKQNCDAVINIANWVDGPQKSAIYQTLSAARAIENQYFVVSTDRKGSDPNVSFTGEKAAYNPLGKNLVQIQDDVAYATLDFQIIEQVRKAVPMI